MRIGASVASVVAAVTVGGGLRIDTIHAFAQWLLGAFPGEADILPGTRAMEDRERALLKFRNGTYPLLISTDLAARGLDIPEIEYVVHYELANAETYLHRNGRTARMQAKGTAYVLLQPNDRPDYLPPSLPA